MKQKTSAPSKSGEGRSRLFLVLSMLIFGTIGIFRKYIPLSSAFLAMARGIIGTAFLLLLALVARRRLSLKAIKSNLAILLVSGAMIGANWMLLFEAYQYTSVATATLCYYMAPIFVMLAAPLFLKERLTGKKLICVAVALGGMVLVSGVTKAGFNAASELKGVVFGLGAAALYAAVVILNQKLHNIGDYEKTIVQLSTAFVVLIPYVLLTENVSAIELAPLTVALVLVVGILNTGVAYILYFGSMRALSAQTVALFGYIDPVVAILLSALVLKESMDATEIVGAVLVLGATMASELPSGKKPKLEKVKNNESK